MSKQYITLKANEVIPEIIKNNKKVAIIGSGPSGLACAEKLAILGYNVDVYDAYDEAGGILTYGIPNFVFDLKQNKFILYPGFKPIPRPINKEIDDEMEYNTLEDAFEGEADLYDDWLNT